ncbi:hypothetical protein [Nonomuraea sp. NPDC049646]|uniref:hypothetical protein n=1 Tax=unclassified Nonomuraea TaxID=2593643 RepID=UPI0037B29CDF
MTPFDKELSRCTWPDGGCNRKILWTVTERGERQPLDAKPDPAGSVAAYRKGPRHWVSRSLLGAGALAPAPQETRFTPHHQTCPKLQPGEPTPEIPGLLPLATVTPISRARRRRRAARGG